MSTIRNGLSEYPLAIVADLPRRLYRRGYLCSKCPFSMRAIENIAVPVTNQQLSKRFYLLLGFELLAEVLLPNGDTWIQLGFRDQVTTISLVRHWPYGRMQAGALQGLVLETDNIVRERDRLHREGVIVSDISESAFGKVFFLQDPDLNGLSIHQFIL